VSATSTVVYASTTEPTAQIGTEADIIDRSALWQENTTRTRIEGEDRMTNEPEGVSARRRMMNGDDRVKASAAAFELGVYFTEGGEAGEAEACYRRSIELGHPQVVPAATLNLAGLFANGGRDDEAEPLYRSILASAAGAHHAAAAYGLGTILGRKPGGVEEAAGLKQAAETADDEL